MSTKHTCSSEPVENHFCQKTKTKKKVKYYIFNNNLFIFTNRYIILSEKVCHVLSTECQAKTVNTVSLMWTNVWQSL